MSGNTRLAKKTMVCFVMWWLLSVYEISCSRKIFVSMGKSHHTLLCGHLSTILFKYISRRGVGYKATTLQLPTPLCTSPSLQGQACLPPIKKKLQPLLQTRGHPLNPSGHLGVQESADSHTYLHIHQPQKEHALENHLQHSDLIFVPRRRSWRSYCLVSSSETTVTWSHGYWCPLQTREPLWEQGRPLGQNHPTFP